MPSSVKEVLIDTSTLFSGLGWSGPPSDVLLTIYSESRYELVLTEYILEELFRNVDRMPQGRRSSAFESLEHLQKCRVVGREDWIQNIQKAEDEVNDVKDAPVLAAYFTDMVDYLVTSNTEDFPLKKYENILTPQQFLSEVEEERLGN